LLALFFGSGADGLATWKDTMSTRLSPADAAPPVGKLCAGDQAALQAFHAKHQGLVWSLLQATPLSDLAHRRHYGLEVVKGDKDTFGYRSGQKHVPRRYYTLADPIQDVWLTFLQAQKDNSTMDPHQAASLLCHIAVCHIRRLNRRYRKRLRRLGVQHSLDEVQEQQEARFVDPGATPLQDLLNKETRERIQESHPKLRPLLDILCDPDQAAPSAGRSRLSRRQLEQIVLAMLREEES
jgi:hypothetical protein